MKQGLILVPRMSLELEEVLDIDFRGAIARIDPASAEQLRCARPEQIRTYLQRVNDRLFEERSAGYTKDLKHHTLIATLIYSFTSKLINLGISETLRDNFVNIMAKPPYELEDCLKVYFKHRSGDIHETEFFANMPLIEVDRTKLKDKDQFKQSDRFKQVMHDRFLGIRNHIKHLGPSYNINLHFSLIAYREVCFPLFNVRHHPNEDDALFRDLKEHYGNFFVTLPKSDEE